MPGDMTIKSSLLVKILEKLASLRMNITIRVDNDIAYILICIDFAVIESGGVKSGYEIMILAKVLSV
jgi:hypothetical protein